MKIFPSVFASCNAAVQAYYQMQCNKCSPFGCHCNVTFSERKMESFWPTEYLENIWVKLTRYWESILTFNIESIWLKYFPITRNFFRILVPPVTQLFRSKWLYFSFSVHFSCSNCNSVMHHMYWRNMILHWWYRCTVTLMLQSQPCYRLLHSSSVALQHVESVRWIYMPWFRNRLHWRLCNAVAIIMSSHLELEKIKNKLFLEISIMPFLDDGITSAKLYFSMKK